jgi:hypothetical protein
MAFSNSLRVDRRRFARRRAGCPALASQPPCQFETLCYTTKLLISLRYDIGNKQTGKEDFAGRKIRPKRKSRPFRTGFFPVEET